jgi:hypothetical protein
MNLYERGKPIIEAGHYTQYDYAQSYAVALARNLGLSNPQINGGSFSWSGRMVHVLAFIYFPVGGVKARIDVQIDSLNGYFLRKSVIVRNGVPTSHTTIANWIRDAVRSDIAAFNYRQSREQIAAQNKSVLEEALAKVKPTRDGMLAPSDDKVGQLVLTLPSKSITADPQRIERLIAALRDCGVTI